MNTSDYVMGEKQAAHGQPGSEPGVAGGLLGAQRNKAEAQGQGDLGSLVRS